MARLGKREGKSENIIKESSVDWYFAQPMIGLTLEGVKVVPPLCTWKELNDGTYNLADVELFNNIINEVLVRHESIQ